MLRSTCLSAVASAAVVLSSLPLVAQTTLTKKVVSDSILPQETYLYISVPDVEAVKSTLKSSSFGQLWDDPALDEFKEEVMNAFENEMQEAMTQFEEASGMTVEEALELPSGEITLAISAAGNSAVGAVVFFDIGDNERKVQPLLDQAVAALSQERNLSSADTSYGGVAITAFEVNYPGPSPTPLAEEFGWFLQDGRLVASNQLELLEAVIDNWSGDAADSFVSNDTYQFVMKRCEADSNPAISKMYMDPIGLFTKLVQTQSLGQQANMGASMALGFLPTFGLNQLKAIAAVGQQGTGEFEVVNRTVVYSDQPATGLMRVFELDQAKTTPPSWVKDNVSTYASMNWEINEAFSAVEQLVDMFQGAGALANILDQMATRGPVHVKQDIIDNLTGEIQLLTAPNSTEQFGGDELLLAFALRNEGAVSDLVDRLAGMSGMQVRDFQGADLYSMEIPGGQAFSLTVRDGNLLFSMGGNLMEQVLRNDDDMRPLAESEEFQRIAAHFPANAVSVSFSRPAETYKSIYEMVRTDGAENFPGVQDLFEKIDFTKLPPFEVIQKYIKPSGAYAIQDDNGYFMQGYQLKD